MIPTAGRSAFFRSFRNLTEQKLSQEWMELSCSAPQFCVSSALNHPAKNRYPDVLAFEQTRVNLKSGEYINANYIDFSPQARFICSQAPLPNTFADFWEMVWEHKSPVVVMLTRLFERRRIQGHCYWPREVGNSEVFGNITVTLLAFEQEPNIDVRRLSLSFNGQQREVWHIHYTEWPDFGVPATTSTIRRVLDLMEEKRSAAQMEEAICPVVHCSAGIGRAGTFLAIQAFVEKMKGPSQSFSDVFVKDIVNFLRTKRMSMVQTKEQYYFIYKVIDDMVLHRSSYLPEIKPCIEIKDPRTILVQSHDQFSLGCGIY